MVRKFIKLDQADLLWYNKKDPVESGLDPVKSCEGLIVLGLDTNVISGDLNSQMIRIKTTCMQISMQFATAEEYGVWLAAVNDPIEAWNQKRKKMVADARERKQWTTQKKQEKEKKEKEKIERQQEKERRRESSKDVSALPKVFVLFFLLYFVGLLSLSLSVLCSLLSLLSALCSALSALLSLLSLLSALSTLSTLYSLYSLLICSLLSLSACSLCSLLLLSNPLRVPYVFWGCVVFLFLRVEERSWARGSEVWGRGEGVKKKSDTTRSQKAKK